MARYWPKQVRNLRFLTSDQTGVDKGIPFLSRTEPLGYLSRAESEHSVKRSSWELHGSKINKERNGKSDFQKRHGSQRYGGSEMGDAMWRVREREREREREEREGLDLKLKLITKAKLYVKA
jgi:hypothetical protein